MSQKYAVNLKINKSYVHILNNCLLQETLVHGVMQGPRDSIFPT